MSAPSLGLPRWVYLPGLTSEPDREPLERAKALVPPFYESCVHATDPAFRYGLALHDAGFFWEAHEVWEAVWKAAPKNGCDRLILRAVVQLANAKLKLRMGRAAAASRLLAEAEAELAEAAHRGCGADRGLASEGALESLAVDLAADPGPLARHFAPMNENACSRRKSLDHRLDMHYCASFPDRKVADDGR